MDIEERVERLERLMGVTRPIRFDWCEPPTPSSQIKALPTSWWKRYAGLGR